MSDVVKFAVPAVLVLIVVGIIAYFVLRRLRGSITLSLSRTSFNAGEKVTGSFHLKTRKQIECNRLYAALIGQRVIEHRSEDRTRTDTDEIYRAEHTFEESVTYPPEHTQQYSFELPTPQAGGPDFFESTVGKALRLGLDALSDRRTRFRWRVEVRLDAKGIDLATSRGINVNLPTGL